MTRDNLVNQRGVLLLNLGGPDSLQAVGPFLYNLFSDSDIIRLPFSEVLQKPIAWWITVSRAEAVRQIYEKLGGKSPILEHTEAQAHALQECLKQEGYDVPVYIAMRYWHPLTEETIRRAIREGIRELIVLPLYPHYSHTTTGSSLNELQRVLGRLTETVHWRAVPPYFNHPDYLNAFAETIQEGLSKNTWSCPSDQVTILFSAHGLPKKFVTKTQDPYPLQIMETCRQVIRTYFPQNPWELSYQSRVGRMPWLGPDTEGLLHYFAAHHVKNVLIVPVSFVSDHLETLYEIDQLYLRIAKELGIEYCHRSPSLNCRPTFIQTLSSLVMERWQEFEQEVPDVTLGTFQNR